MTKQIIFLESVFSIVEMPDEPVPSDHIKMPSGTVVKEALKKFYAHAKETAIKNRVPFADQERVKHIIIQRHGRDVGEGIKYLEPTEGQVFDVGELRVEVEYQSRWRGTQKDNKWRKTSKLCFDNPNDSPGHEFRQVAVIESTSPERAKASGEKWIIYNHYLMLVDKDGVGLLTGEFRDSLGDPSSKDELQSICDLLNATKPNEP